VVEFFGICPTCQQVAPVRNGGMKMPSTHVRESRPLSVDKA
jgi:hypothetical protein